MNTNNYLLYTGFVDFTKHKNEDLTEIKCSDNKYASLTSEEFFEIWYKNTRKYIGENISIYILGPDKPNLKDKQNIYSLIESENLGHFGDLLTGKKNNYLIGYTASAIYGMMHAYILGKDFVYKEQDCLAFGDYIQEMYKTSGKKSVVLGTNKVQACSTALHLIRREAIPLAIKTICEEPDVKCITEKKYSRMINAIMYSFGYDRDRPFNAKDKIFYIQQIKKHELEILKNENLI